MATIYHYPKCSTCRKALKWLKEHDIEADIKDITLETPTKETLMDIMNASDLDIRKFFNTSGKIYKERKLKDVVGSLTVDEAAELLSEEGMLIKRPLYIDGKNVILGFKEDAYSEKVK